MVMSHNSRHSIDSCTLQLHSWRPFLDSDPPTNSKPYASSRTLPKRPCLSDRATSFPSNIDSIDISKLSLLQDDDDNNNNKPIPAAPAVTNSPYKRGTLRLIERKRRRRGSRSVSGRSSDRSGTWRCCSVDSKMEMVGENTFDPKTHHRCRRRKHDYRMVRKFKDFKPGSHPSFMNWSYPLHLCPGDDLVVYQKPFKQSAAKREAREESHEAEEQERMRTISILITFLFLSWLTCAPSWGSGNGDTYVREACSVTRYHDLCVHSLASFSHTAGRSPSKWARAGVSVTIGEAKNASQYLNKLKKDRIMRGRNRIALSDCIECFQDAIDNLHRSLGILRKLDATNFDTQMGDLVTWLSAALTDEDTCLDGFEDQSSKQVKMLHNQVSRVTYITSNALALANKLAAAGLGSQNGL
ncbi:hypothetical protein NC651_032356 [Populus alba x Populus x berolinensis]|nr:hypothetical protein NC651_032356 [Populus alba x Populus x berolinensis]